MKTVLVIEDEENLLDLYEDEFKIAGYEVCRAATGREGIECVRKYNPDLVILDLLLSDMQGLNVLEEIKSINKDIPVIINSAYSTYKADFSTWMADDYVVKSSEISVLIDRARSIVSPF